MDTGARSWWSGGSLPGGCSGGRGDTSQKCSEARRAPHATDGAGDSRGWASDSGSPRESAAGRWTGRSSPSLGSRHAHGVSCDACRRSADPQRPRRLFLPTAGHPRCGSGAATSPGREGAGSRSSADARSRWTSPGDAGRAGLPAHSLARRGHPAGFRASRRGGGRYAAHAAPRESDPTRSCTGAPDGGACATRAHRAASPAASSRGFRRRRSVGCG